MLIDFEIGIGKGVLSHYLSRSNNLIIAGVRDVAKAAHLSALSKGPGSSLLIVKIDASNHDDPAAAVEELKTRHRISHLDVVVSCAGIAVPNHLEALPIPEL